MKRILAIFLAVALVFSISACGTDTSEKPSEGEKVSETEETSEISTDELLSDAPDTYDYALRISINPEFILYLVEHRVVAYQALNADAQKVDERAAIEGGEYLAAGGVGLFLLVLDVCPFGMSGHSNLLKVLSQ